MIVMIFMKVACLLHLQYLHADFSKDNFPVSNMVYVQDRGEV